MPQVFKVMGYTIYFWSNEGSEPVHFHISKQKPTANATKFWILSDGSLLLAHNRSRFTSKELRNIITLIYSYNIVPMVVNLWQVKFPGKAIKFYK